MNSTYLTYEEYKVNGGVTCSYDDFPILEFRARKRIDELTDCRVQAMSEVPNAVKLCMVTVIEMLSRFSAEAMIAQPTVASFSTDGYSESYGSAADQEKAATRSADAAIRSLLYGETDDTGTFLLYRGLVL